MFPINFPDLTREAFLRVANHPGKLDPGSTLDENTAVFLASDCGVPVVVFVDWREGGTPRADMYVPTDKASPSPWTCARINKTEYLTLLFPLSYEGTPLDWSAT